ncbi:Alpha-amylase [Dactylella cylindrospora]|nr:Alpha-amylase [Dactylella cylindrospora]
MKPSYLFSNFLLLVCSFISFAGAVVLGKRDTQVSLISYTYSNNILAGYISVQNIAYQKVVSVYWAQGNNWQSTPISASYYSGPASNGFETWVFSGTASGATQLYIKYDVSGTSYYYPGNYVNVQVTSSSTTASSTTTSRTTTSSSRTSTTTTSGTTSVSIQATTSSSSTSTVPFSGSVSPSSIPSFRVSPIPSETPATAPSGCGNWNGQDSCASGSSTFPDSSENRRWQTPPNTDPQYVSTFQTFGKLVGYADIQYNSARTAAVVVINCLSKTGAAFTYYVNNVAQSSNLVQVTTANTGGLNIRVTDTAGGSLTLETLYFLWENPAVSGGLSTFNSGQKGAIVELFGWPYDDVANECAFLSKAGYMGVKIWPPQEHVWGSNYYEPDNQFRPWYFVYQPVSYRLHSRSGTREQLRNMIKTCRSLGVRVYADAVINHMTGNGNDIQNHRNSDCSTYTGHNATDGSPYFTSGSTYLINPYTGTRPTFEFPAVPYGPTDFHCDCALNSWTDGLTDLNTEKPYVQDRIATYLTDLLSIGFSGFRVDAAKHIGPTSMAQILARFKQKLGGSNLPADWISWHEIIMGGEASLLACGGGEWSWYTNFNTKLSGVGFSQTDIDKTKIWSSDYPKEHPICGSWIIPSTRFVIQNDDHDQQNPGSSSRDMQDKGSVLIKSKDVAAHRGFEVQLFTRTDGDWQIRNILSSYLFMDNGASGFPDGYSDCSLYTGTQSLSGCLGVPYDQAYVASACGYTMSQGKYTRVHRDLSIINAMRGWVGLGSTTASALGIPGCT